MRESKIEAYLRVEMKRAGGTTRKFKSPGHNHMPDRLVLWPNFGGHALVHFVETKASNKKVRAGQAREHERLRNLGCDVFVLDSIEKVDNYIQDFKPYEIQSR